MNLKKNIKTIVVVATIAIIVVARLVSNKNSFDREQKLISESANIVSVITEKVGYQSVNSAFSADGVFSAENEVSLLSEISGKVISVNTEVGNIVREGQVVAVLDHTVLSVQLQQAKANLLKLEKDLQRNETLLSTDGATGQQVEQSKQAVVDAQVTLISIQNQYDNSFIKAPFAGTVTKRYVEKGAFLSQGSPIFDISGIDRLKFVAKVSAAQMSEIKKGEKVTVTADDFTGNRMDAMVFAINNKSGQSNLYDVKIATGTSFGGKIKSGMYGKALFSGKSASKMLVISRVAIPGSIKDAEVYLVKGDSVVTRKITVAPLNEKEVSVASGLQEGDVVVISGQINLTNGSKIKIIK